MSINVPIYTRSPLHDEIGPDLMRRMRTEKGMSNQEIAQACGVSYATVHRYIGKQGFRAKKDASAEIVTSSGEEASPDSQQSTPALRLLRETECIMKGEFVTYTLSTEAKSVTAMGGSVELAVTYPELVRLIRELLEVERYLSCAAVVPDEAGA